MKKEIKYSTKRMKKIKIDILILILILILIVITNITNVFGEEINIRQLIQDKSIVVLSNTDNSKIINTVDKIILIDFNGEAISVPKENYKNFTTLYKLIGVEKNNTYYIYDTAKYLIDDIIDMQNDKRIITLFIFFVILIFIFLLLGVIIKIFIDNAQDGTFLLCIIFIIVTNVYSIGIKHIEQSNFEKSIKPLIHSYIEPEDVKLLSN